MCMFPQSNKNIFFKIFFPDYNNFSPSKALTTFSKKFSKNYFFKFFLLLKFLKRVFIIDALQ